MISCPYCRSNDDIEFAKNFCAYYAPEKYGWCYNYTSDMDESHFDVREVKVIE